MKRLLQSDAFKNFDFPAIVILTGLLVGAVVIFISNSSEALDSLRTLFAGPIGGGMLGTGRVLYHVVPIIMTGSSVGFAFKTGLSNIRAPRQFVMGALAAIYVGVKQAFLPGNIHWLAVTLAAFAAGSLWAIIPGVMEAYLNVNEVTSSIMVDYIGIYLANYSVSPVLFGALRDQSLPVASTAVVPRMGFDKIFTGSPANGGFVIATLFVILIYIILSKISFGYEMKACGFNKDASKYAGTNEKHNTVLSTVVTDALAGVGGGPLYLSGFGKFVEVADVFPAGGFNGIPVALLGLSNPIGVLFTGLFTTYLNVGGNAMQQFGFIPQIIDIIISCIIYCFVLSLIIKVWLSKRRKTEELGTAKKEGE